MTNSAREEIEKVREIAAQLWCLPEHSHKEMDAELCNSIANAILTQVEKARDEERERCASIADHWHEWSQENVAEGHEIYGYRKNISKEIRNKLEKE